MVRRLSVLAACFAALALFPAGAGAATICVAISAPACDEAAAGVQEALEAAGASSADDRVVIGAGRFEGPFVYPPGLDAGQLEVVGQGDQTILSADQPVPEKAITVLNLSEDGFGQGAAVSDVSVQVPANTEAFNPGNTGIKGAGVVDRVEVTYGLEDAASNSPAGVRLTTTGAIVRNSEIDMPFDGFGIGVDVSLLSEGEALIADARIGAAFGVFGGRSAAVTRSRIVASQTGVQACNAPVSVDNSLIRLVGTSADGLQATGANQCGSTQGSLTARHVTIVGSGITGGQIGASAAVGVAGQNPTVTISHSVVRDVETALRLASVVVGTATIRISSSDFEGARITTTAVGGGAIALEQPQPNIDADPLFVDPLAGIFSLSPGSPAIDSAFSPPLAAGESATDLAGNPRITDGDGDGVAARDMGAFERPGISLKTIPPDTSPPETRITRGPKARVLTRRRRVQLQFRFASDEAGSSFQCKLDRGAFAPCSSPYSRRVRPGSHVFRVRAIDPAGNADPTPAERRVKVVRKRLRTGSGPG